MCNLNVELDTYGCYHPSYDMFINICTSKRYLILSAGLAMWMAVLASLFVTLWRRSMLCSDIAPEHFLVSYTKKLRMNRKSLKTILNC